MGTYEGSEGEGGDINKILNFHIFLPLFLFLSHIFKVKLKLKFLTLSHYLNTFHQSQAFSLATRF
jgi:hypothetical protein